MQKYTTIITPHSVVESASKKENPRKWDTFIDRTKKAIGAIMVSTALISGSPAMASANFTPESRVVLKNGGEGKTFWELERMSETEVEAYFNTIWAKNSSIIRFDEYLRDKSKKQEIASKQRTEAIMKEIETMKQQEMESKKRVETIDAHNTLINQFGAAMKDIQNNPNQSAAQLRKHGETVLAFANHPDTKRLTKPEQYATIQQMAKDLLNGKVPAHLVQKR